MLRLECYYYVGIVRFSFAVMEMISLCWTADDTLILIPPSCWHSGNLAIFVRNYLFLCFI